FYNYNVIYNFFSQNTSLSICYKLNYSSRYKSRRESLFMLLILNLFRKKKTVKSEIKKGAKPKQSTQVAVRKGEIGEYKIDIQLSQFPKNYKFLNDIMLENPKSVSGYSQIDHMIITPFGIFVIETKNYQGTIYGGKG